MSVPVGHGLPVWLDTELYLSADETRLMPNVCHWPEDYSVNWRTGRCPICHGWKTLQRAHIVRVGSSGARKSGTDGPQIGVCFECHSEVDSHQASKTFAVRRFDRAIVLLLRDDDAEVVLSEGLL